MTIEEAIRELKIQFVGEYDRQREAKDMAIKALKEQGNPNSIRINFVGEEEAKEFKKYLKNQQPCEDCISRQAVLDEMYKRKADDDAITPGFIKNLPPVIPQQKTGYWIAITKDEKSAVCSCCNLNNFMFGDYCKWCGAKNDFFKPQESEE